MYLEQSISDLDGSFESSTIVKAISSPLVPLSHPQHRSSGDERAPLHRIPSQREQSCARRDSGSPTEQIVEVSRTFQSKRGTVSPTNIPYVANPWSLTIRRRLLGPNLGGNFRTITTHVRIAGVLHGCPTEALAGVIR